MKEQTLMQENQNQLKTKQNWNESYFKQREQMYYDLKVGKVERTTGESIMGSVCAGLCMI